VRVQRRHRRRTGVEGEQQVEALLEADLSHDEPAGPHPQVSSNQVTQLDLAGPFEPALPGRQTRPTSDARGRAQNY